MIKLYTAFTTEIDDVEAAVREIREQLKPDENALKNTIGIVHFYPEFVETGVCQALMDALPFELVGCVSSYLSAGGEYSDIALSVAMITSDEIRFSVRTLEDVKTKTRDHINQEVIRLIGDLCAEAKPKMVIPFLSPLPQFSGDELVKAVNSLDDPFPLFGTVAFNMESTDHSSYVIGSGKISTAFQFLAFYGDFEPGFYATSSFDFEKSYGNVAEITDAVDCTLKSVNGMTALAYLKKQGLIGPDNSVSGASTWTIPALLTYPNGAQVVRGFIGILEGTEFIISTGQMEVGTKIKFALLDGDKTLASAEGLIKELNAEKKNDVIAYSCAARVWSLGSKFFAEAQKIADCADQYMREHNIPFNYTVAYSGGEICPVFNDAGKLVNILHNYTLIACAFN